MRQGRQATGTATLAPVERTKGGKVYWNARGSVPVRDADGSVGSRRVERGFGPDIETEAQRITQCAIWNREYEERFRNPRRLITFARAYTTYIGKGHQVPYYAADFLPLLGELQCADIDDSVMADATEEIWPDGAAPSTINRHLYSPVIAILHMALKERAPELKRPKGHNDVKPVEIPPEEWYRGLAPELNPNQLAFVMFLAMHGRRIGEALGRRPADLDVASGNLDLGKTKTGVRQIEVHPKCLSLLVSMPGWQKRRWLFGAGPTSVHSFRRDIKAAVARAGLRWYTPHSFGRHMSVTRMLRAGFSVAHVADAHGMTPEMVTRRYGHLTKRETTAALHAVGGALFDKTFGERPGEEKAEIDVSEVAKSDKSQYLLSNSAVDILSRELPSEGSALSSCATGAKENNEN